MSDALEKRPTEELMLEVNECLRALSQEDTVYTTAEMLDRIMADDDANDPYLAELQSKYADAR
jgi:hypothetical protein